eukprot:5254404-Alexandrium_andersonii.AAC.1
MPRPQRTPDLTAYTIAPSILGNTRVLLRKWYHDFAHVGAVQHKLSSQVHVCARVPKGVFLRLLSRECAIAVAFLQACSCEPARMSVFA